MNKRQVLFALAASLCMGSALAEAYPDKKPVKLVVPFAPGGYVDTIGRATAKFLQSKLGTTVVVENRAGAGGSVGLAHVARQPPDGYTLAITPMNMVIAPEADKLFNRPAQYSVSQFTPVAMITAETLLVIVPVASPWQTLDDLIRDAKQRPGKISYSSSGIYGNIHLPAEMLFRKASAQLIHAAYQGGAPAMMAVLSGDVNLTLQSPAVAMPHLKSGKVRVLATLGAQRLPELPDVQTVRELGYDMELASWSTVFVPAGTPEPVLATLRKALREVTNDPEFRATIAAQNSTVRFLEGPALQQAIARDTAAMADVVRSVGRLE